MKPNILICPKPEDWAAFAAQVISQTIHSVISNNGVCRVMLTGGNTVKPLYENWANTSVLPLKQISFFFGDERCVPLDHIDSNYAMVMKTLLVDGIPSGCSIWRMEANSSDLEAATQAYEELIPEIIDVLLLSVGSDGHIASLFPCSSALHSERRVVSVAGPKPPHNRLTITPQVIVSARFVFVLATGPEKGRVLNEALKSEDDFWSLPVRLALSRTWLLDNEAGGQIENPGKNLKGIES